MSEVISMCNRGACSRTLYRGLYRIWNQGNNIPREYCIDCGRRIIEANKEMLRAKLTDIELKFEIIP